MTRSGSGHGVARQESAAYFRSRKKRLQPIWSINPLESIETDLSPHPSGAKTNPKRSRPFCRLILDKTPLMFNNKVVLSAGYLPRASETLVSEM